IQLNYTHRDASENYRGFGEGAQGLYPKSLLHLSHICLRNIISADQKHFSLKSFPAEKMPYTVSAWLKHQTSRGVCMFPSICKASKKAG
ncbi:MAG: hypothetical protein RR186_06110, partial [Raoultibacter sp.]